MADKNEPTSANILSFKTPEARFPKAAVDYIDALLTVQRDRFNRELAAREAGPNSNDSDYPTRPNSAHIIANSDEFLGAGWTTIGKRRDGTTFRWMGRLGSLMLPVDLSETRPFTIRGCGFTRRRFLKETTLWLDDQQLQFSISRQGFNRWTFTGQLPAMPPRPYYLLRLQSSGLAPLAEGVDARVSLAVSEIRVNC